MLPLSIALSLMIGVVLGMLGGGGAILMLPMLVYVIGVDPRTAIAMSLFVIGATGLFGMIMHARTGAVRWKEGSMFGAAAMVGAFGGGRIAHFIPASALLILFGIVMVASAIGMLRPKTAPPIEKAPIRIGRMLALGAAVGLVSGLVGAGGGFLIVPSLVLLAGLSMREGIATSLFVIVLQSLAGFAGHLARVSLDWTLTLFITAAAAAGSVVGARAGGAIPATQLRRAFAWLVIAMASFTFVKQLPPVAGRAATGLTLLAALFAVRKSRSERHLAHDAARGSSPLPSQPPNPDPHPSSP